MWRNLSHRKLDKVLEEIYFKSMLPTVTYGIVVWGNCTSEIMDTLDPVHEKAARLILQQGHSKKSNLLPISFIFKRHLFLLTHDVFQACVGCKPLWLLVKSNTITQMLTDALIRGQQMTCGVIYQVFFFHLSLRKTKMPDHRLLLYVQAGLFCNLWLAITDELTNFLEAVRALWQLNFNANASGCICHHDLGYWAKPCLFLAVLKGQRHLQKFYPYFYTLPGKFTF